MRRAFSPVQNAASVSAPPSPAGLATRAGGLLLYSAFSAVMFPAATAAFHCCSGANAPAAPTFCAHIAGRHKAQANRPTKTALARFSKQGLMNFIDLSAKKKTRPLDRVYSNFHSTSSVPDCDGFC